MVEFIHHDVVEVLGLEAAQVGAQCRGLHREAQQHVHAEVVPGVAVQAHAAVRHQAHEGAGGCERGSPPGAPRRARRAPAAWASKAEGRSCPGRWPHHQAALTA